MKLTKKFLSSIHKDYKDLSTNVLADIIQQSNYAYHTLGKPILTDVMYDLLKDELISKSPKHPILSEVGAPVPEDERKTELPYHMASMNKLVDDEKGLDKYVSTYKGSYAISDKLDGVSALVQVKNNEIKLYSRGNGSVGQDISHLIPFIQDIPKLDLKNDIAVRGELIISRKNFEQFFSNVASNGRNLVAGQVNAKLPDLQVLEKTSFIAYNVYEDRAYSQLETSKQYALLQKYKFKVVHNIQQKDISLDILLKLLTERKNKSDYEIDGIIIAHDFPYDLKPTNSNPKHAFAFKSESNMESAQVVVRDVEWNISKDNLMKPVVLIEPTKINNVIIKRATGFNAEYIVKNKIGPGAILVIQRSGDVIPHIKTVVKPAKHASLPSMEYTWTDSGKDIVAITTDDLKQIQNFFKVLNPVGVSTGTIKKMYEKGFTTIQAFKDYSIGSDAKKSEINTYNALKTVFEKEIPCSTLMVASNSFGRGFGNRRIDAILEKFPYDPKNTPSTNELQDIDGVSLVTAKQYVEGLQNFRNFITKNKLNCKTYKNKTPSTSQTKNNGLIGKSVVFSGFRDKDLEKAIIERKGKVMTSVSSKTDILVVSSIDERSSKIEKALSLNIPLVQKDTFYQTYII